MVGWRLGRNDSRTPRGMVLEGWRQRSQGEHETERRRVVVLIVDADGCYPIYYANQRNATVRMKNRIELRDGNRRTIIF